MFLFNSRIPLTTVPLTTFIWLFLSYSHRLRLPRGWYPLQLHKFMIHWDGLLQAYSFLMSASSYLEVNLGWDDPVPQTILQQWEMWKSTLPLIQSFPVCRSTKVWNSALRLKESLEFINFILGSQIRMIWIQVFGSSTSGTKAVYAAMNSSVVRSTPDTRYVLSHTCTRETLESYISQWI